MKNQELRQAIHASTAIIKKEEGNLLQLINQHIKEVIGGDEPHNSMESNEQYRFKNILNEAYAEQRKRAGLDKGGSGAA